MLAHRRLILIFYQLGQEVTTRRSIKKSRIGTKSRELIKCASSQTDLPDGSTLVMLENIEHFSFDLFFSWLECDDVDLQHSSAGTPGSAFIDLWEAAHRYGDWRLQDRAMAWYLEHIHDYSISPVAVQYVLENAALDTLLWQATLEEVSFKIARGLYSPSDELLLGGLPGLFGRVVHQVNDHTIDPLDKAPSHPDNRSRYMSPESKK